jgi:hypothetical protein
LARELGYARMRLDTFARLREARALYESLGFREVPAYWANPLERIEGVLYFEAKL